MMYKKLYINHCILLSLSDYLNALQGFKVTLDRGSLVILMVGYYKSGYRSN